eukprot:2404067-Pyramimonas_sp.AAC.1
MDLSDLYAGLHALGCAPRDTDGDRPRRPEPQGHPDAQAGGAPTLASLTRGLHLVSSSPTSSKSSFSGSLYGGPAHSQFLHACKRLKRSEDQRREDADAYEPLQTAWNEERLRSGTMVGHGDHALHCNQYSPHQVLINSWLQIGKNKCLREGIDGHHRGLDMVAAVSAAAIEDQTEWLSAELSRMQCLRASPVISKFYDCTPHRFRFGRLQAVLHPHARYPLLVDDRWTTVTLDDYLAAKPDAGPMRFGILELLAQGITCSYTSPVTDQMHAVRVLCRPRILQS